MTPSSPYAAFRAEEWMRTSMIRPRKVFSQALASQACSASSAAPSRQASASTAVASLVSPSVVQGELFLFPVIVGC